MLHYFNPGHESAVLNASPYYMAPANVVQMQRDLAFLPVWYARKDDYVLLEKTLSDDFKHFLSDNFKLGAKAIIKDDINKLSDQLNELEVNLWGISPQAIHLFESLNERYELNLSIPKWRSEYADYCHRKTAAEWLTEICHQLPQIDSKLIPHFYISVEEVEERLQKESETFFLAKAPYSSSGRGLLWLPKGGLTRTERQILHGIIKKQKSTSLEYKLNKSLDFAMEFYCEGKCNAIFYGYSLFETSTKGSYESNLIQYQNDIESTICKNIGKELLEEVKQILLDVINKDLSPIYKGYLGVDMMIYQQDDSFFLHPCVEINLRSNMGIVALNLQKHLAPNSQGRFKIDFASQKGNAYHKHKEREQDYPLLLSDDGKVISGYFPLCPIDSDSHYSAYAMIEGK